MHDALIDSLEDAIRANPDRPEPYWQLGMFLQQISEPEAARACYEDGLRADPHFVPLLQNLGFLLSHLGEPEAALEFYERACQVSPSPMTRMLNATLLPALYDSVDEIDLWRSRLTREVNSLVREGIQVPTSQSQIPTNFYLAYQGRNDRSIAEQLGSIYTSAGELPEVTHPAPRVGTSDRIRIGVLSAFLHDHTIGRLNLGLVEHLSRELFHVTALSVEPPDDAWSRRFEAAADDFVPLPRDVALARQRIRDRRCDVLLFADVGMDSLTTTLAFSRLAPVQCSTWGHPVTTGSPAIDYFVSSELMEIDGADEHYTERLVRLPGLGVCYHRPAAIEPHVNRHTRSGDRDRHRYVCPQTLYKFHPDFDAVLRGILQADPRAEIVLLEGRVSNWTEKLQRRFARTLPNPERVTFLSPLAHEDYLSLLRAADVILDPLHFGGGNSSYEAFAVGTPIVTLPSDLLRGRITAGLYRRMNFTDLIVSSVEDYVRQAVRLATDPAERARASERIVAAGPILFDHREEIRGWEDFLMHAARAQRPNERPPDIEAHSAYNRPS